MNQSQQDKNLYAHMAKVAAPKSKVATNCLRAFLVGGTICTVAELIHRGVMQLGATREDAGLITATILIVTAIILTGFGLYSRLGKFAGAGSIVPITGFANSVAAPAIEHKTEGYVMGVGAKMFVIAGPVIVYGLLTSVAVGLVYYFVR